MMWASFTKKLMAFGAFLITTGVALVMLWTAARKSGKAEANETSAQNEVKRIRRETNQAIVEERAANEKQLQAVENANEVAKNVGDMSNDVIRNELLNNWRRLED